MLKTIILICSVSTDPSACTVDTAVDSMRFQTNGICGLSAQISMAEHRVAPEPGKTYAKIVCERPVIAGR